MCRFSGRCSSRPRPSSRLPSFSRARMKSFLMRDSGLSSISAASLLVAVAGLLDLVEGGVEALEERLALRLDDLLVALDGVVERLLELLRREVAVHLQQDDLARRVVDADGQVGVAVVVLGLVEVEDDLLVGLARRDGGDQALH